MSDLNAVKKELSWTGERYIPEVQGEIELEHTHRYLLAKKISENKRVLDVASGEGYGSALLAEVAKSVVGVDISAEAIDHASKKYTSKNLKFILGSCTNIPLDDNSIDVVVSFETIEHHDKHHEMMGEIKRVLTPNGILIISSPDKLEYSDKLNYKNPFHIKEIYRNEFEDLLEKYFLKFQINGQKIIFGSAIISGKFESFTKSISNNTGEFSEVTGLSNPVYLIALASDTELPILDDSILEQDLKKSNAVIELEGQISFTKKMLDSKDSDWTIRLNQCATDFEKEISRIAAEREILLEEKDSDWTIRLNQCATDYENEILRIAAERDKLLDQKNKEIYSIDKLLNAVRPKVSVVTVNFNGKKFLKGLIESLAAQTFQADEIIVVDNFSTDESLAYIKENFPYIKIVQSNTNNGFAGGNNLGVRSAIHPLVALINNDTIVEPTWLENLVGTWVKQTASGEKIGAVSPKITFLRKFLTFQLTAPLFRYVDGDERFLGVAIDFSNSGITNANYIKPIIVSGFHQEENWPGGRIVHWTSGHAELMLPIPEDYINDKVILKIIATAGNRVGGSELKIECKGLDLGPYCINDDFSDICVEIPTELLKSASWVINNAGSKLNEYGNAADIGINQIDKGQFDDVSNIDAFCGCSVLISRATFLTLGGFDDRFFMYYEDADLSWKMRKNNLKIIFESKSVVRHIHAGSSGEWSPGFRYYVTRNYRLIGFKNSSLINLIFLILRFFISFCFSLRINGLNVWRKQKRNKLVDMTPAQIELKALTDVFALTPRILLDRIKSLL